MGNKQGSLGHHMETASKTGALAFPDKKLESFPDDLTKVAATLRTLDLSSNKITTLPSSIGNFRSLKTLNLSNNRITEIPPTIGNCQKLGILYLNGNRITNLPETLANLKNLKEIHLGDNRVGKFPMMLCKLKKLDLIEIPGNKITEIPTSQGDNLIEDLSVTELNLNRNQVSGISAAIAQAKRLKTLRLEENCLTLENLPTELLESSVVSTLNLNGNLFSDKQFAEVEGYSAYLERYTAVRRKMD